MKVRIKNFQSVEDAEIEIDGFTTLVGKSNIGKSAIIRAIQGALTNREGEDFVTRGKDHTEVELDCPAINLVWRKGGGYNDYEINGELLESVGRGSPPHIAEAGFGEMKVGRETISVQVSDQFKPLFLLNEVGSLAAEAISDVGRLTDVQTALRNCEKDRRNVRSERKVRQQDLDDVNEELNRYDNYEDDMEQVEEIRVYYRDITALHKEIDGLKALDTKRQVQSKIIQKLAGVEDLEIPVWDGDDDVKEVERLERLERRYERGRTELKRYAGVEKIEIPVWDSDDLFDEIKVLDSLDAKAKRIQGVIGVYDGLKDLELPDLADIDADHTEYEMLEGFADQLDQVVSMIPTLKKQISDLDTEIEATKDELHQTLHDAGQCPTCEQEVT